MKLQRLYIATLLLLLLGSIGTSFAQESLFSYEKYVNSDGDTLRYRQFVSDYDTLSKFPLVIFLHGAGERGNDNQAQLKWGVKNFASVEIMKTHRPIVIAPQCPDNVYWGNYAEKKMSLEDSPTQPMKLLIELIHQLIQTQPIDTSRIYITGLSIGGYGVYDIISREPDLFAAAVPVCGAGDVSKAKTFAHIPMWIFHGALDATVSPDYSRKMLQALAKVGATPGFTQYPEAGHSSWIAAYSDKMMLDWLFSQRKK